MKPVGKRILITGGTSGIGRELVWQLHKHNEVIVIARPTERLERLMIEIDGIKAYGADLGWQEDINSVGQKISEDYPELDLVIHNAAVQHPPHFIDENFCPDHMVEEITLNFTAICSLTARLLPSLMHEREAAILMINSGLALAPKTGSAVYCATKAAIDSLSRSLRYQLADSNIAILQAYLPLVDTAMTSGRGSAKISACEAAEEILHGLEFEIADHAIGKVKMLQRLMRISPSLGRSIMRKTG